MATTKKTKTRPSSKAKSSRATTGKRAPKPRAAAATRSRKKAGTKSPAKGSKSPAKKGKAAGKPPKRRQQPAPEAPAQDLPEFAVAFIDGEGQAHVAIAAALDPAAALADLLDQAAMFEEPFLDDLVAVMVSHPTTWESVKAKVVGVFSE